MSENGDLDLSKARQGQRKAIQLIVHRVRQGEHETAIILPTRYGKSDVIRVPAFYLWQQGILHASLALSPNEYLRDQLINEKRMYESLLRYSLLSRMGGRISFDKLETHRTNFTANGEFLISATIQLINQFRQFYMDWIGSVFYKTGKSIIVFADETHLNSDANEFGETLKSLRDAGAHLVVLTATALRADRAALVGFRVNEVDSKSIKFTIKRPGSTPNLTRVDLYEGQEILYELLADHETKFKSAWEENVLCHISRKPFDIDLRKIDLKDGTAEQCWLSELSESNTRRALGKLVRHPSVIQSGCREFLHWLREVRKAGASYRNCGGIVFCGNDTMPDDQLNEHARQIRRELLNYEPSLRIVIATSGNDRDKSGKKMIEAFVDRDDGDVLIVKQMASLGLDCPRLKVALDLSPVRTPAAFIQRICRTATPYLGMLTAIYVCPADILSEACFDTLIEAQGGASSKAVELVDTYEVPKEENPLPLFSVNGIKETNFEDTKRNRATAETIRRVQAIIDCFPTLIISMTLPEIAEKSEALLHLITATEPRAQLLPSYTERDSLANACFAFGKEITLARLWKITSVYDPKLYGTISTDVWVLAYDSCQVSKELRDLRKISDLTILQNLYAFLEALRNTEIEGEENATTETT